MWGNIRGVETKAAKDSFRQPVSLPGFRRNVEEQSSETRGTYYLHKKIRKKPQ